MKADTLTDLWKDKKILKVSQRKKDKLGQFKKETMIYSIKDEYRKIKIAQLFSQRKYPRLRLI